MSSLSSQPHFSRYPLFWLAICFSVGILAGKYAAPDLFFSLSICGLASLTALFVRNYLSPALIAIAFVTAGSSAMVMEMRAIRADRLKVLYDSGTIQSRSPVEVEGVLMGRPEPAFDSSFLTVQAEKLYVRGEERRVSGNVRLFVPVTSREQSDSRPIDLESREQSDSTLNDLGNGEPSGLKFQISDLKYGSRIRVACELEREDEYLNPGVLPKREVLDRLGVDATATIKSPLLIEHVADESVFLPMAWVYDQRTVLIEDFRQNLGRPAAGVMIASLLGDKYFLDKSTSDLFREGGTFHILVISGLHITFIGGLVLLFIRQFTGNRWLHFGLTMTFVWAYTLAVGGEPPVVRAAVMFMIVLFGYADYRKGAVLNSLGLCALVLLTWRPSDLLNPSLQLTFVSVGAIIAAAYPLVDKLRRIGIWSPSKETPFPPNVPIWLRRFCEMIYWSESIWSLERKRQIWSANLFKSPYLNGRMGKLSQRVARYVFEGILISLIVQIWMLPLMVVYFHRMSVASVLLNLWVEFFIALESFAAVAGAVLSHISGILAVPFFGMADILNWCMLAFPRLLSTVDWASFRLPAYGGYAFTIYFLFFLPIIVLAVAAIRWDPFELRSRSKFLSRRVLYPTGATCLGLFALIVFHPLSAPRPDGRLHVDFLDVGQGDSALVTFPDGETLLIDGGGKPGPQRSNDGNENEPFEPDTRRVGEAVVSEVLWSKGYSRIGHIMATHSDVDHMQGLSDVARNFVVDSALFGRFPEGSSEFAEIEEVLRRRDIPVEIIARGDVMKFGDTTVDVLWPVESNNSDDVYDNNHSAVLRIVYGVRSFLLVGDIESESEAALVTRGDALRSDLIKVAHHGSRTSSTQQMVEKVHPTYAIVSVGRYSRFGHPHADVIQRWIANGADVRTTGERGLISVSTEGKDMRLETFLK